MVKIAIYTNALLAKGHVHTTGDANPVCAAVSAILLGTWTWFSNQDELIIAASSFANNATDDAKNHYTIVVQNHEQNQMHLAFVGCQLLTLAKTNPEAVTVTIFPYEKPLS